MKSVRFKYIRFKYIGEEGVLFNYGQIINLHGRETIAKCFSRPETWEHIPECSRYVLWKGKTYLGIKDDVR